MTPSGIEPATFRLVAQCLSKKRIIYKHKKRKDSIRQAVSWAVIGISFSVPEHGKHPCPKVWSSFEKTGYMFPFYLR